MKKIIKLILQNIRWHQQQVNNHKLLLISKFKNNNGYKKDDNIANTETCDFNTTYGSDSYVSDTPNELKHENKYKLKRKQIYEWIASSKPTHFLTIQFPTNMRSDNLNVSKNHLRRFMARFEQYLVGSRWTGKHIPFYAFAEKGRHDGYNYHFHILLNCSGYGNEPITKALNNACLNLSLSLETYYIEEVKDNEVIYYCLKDIKTFNKTDWYDRIIPSNILFGL